jgi:hypothetical protein
MQDRYGTAQPRRRMALIAATTVLGVVFLAWVIWAAWLHANPEIDAAVARFDIVNDHEAQVQVDARFRDANVRGNCLLRASASDHTVVGELVVTVGQLRADQGSLVTVRTERRATTVELVSCSVHEG